MLVQAASELITLKWRLTTIFFLISIIGGLIYLAKTYPHLFDARESPKKNIKIKLDPKTTKETFMVGQNQYYHVQQFYENVKTGALDDAYNLLPASFRMKITRDEFKADFQNNPVTNYILLSEKQGTDEYSIVINYTRQDGSNWSAEWIFARPEYEWIVSEISASQM